MSDENPSVQFHTGDQADRVAKLLRDRGVLAVARREPGVRMRDEMDNDVPLYLIVVNTVIAR
jgi:hypothetical protein